MNRHFLPICCLLSLALQSFLHGDWPRWRGAQGDGTWNGPEISRVLPTAGLKRVWKTKVFPGYSGITIQDGLLYLMDRPNSEEGKGMERIVCLNASTGVEVWSFSYPVDYGDMGYGKGPRSSVTVEDGRVFTLGARGHAFAFNSQTGEKIWMRNLVAEENATVPIWGFSSSPEPHASEVLFHVGCQPTGSVLALSQANGETKWKVGRDEGAGYAPPLLIESKGGPQLICWGPNQIMGLPIGGGQAYWEVPYEVKYGVSITKPIYHEDIILVSEYWHGTRAILLGEKLRNAKILWSDEINLRGLMSQALYRKGICFLLDRSSGLSAFELKSGKILWRDQHQLTPSERNPQASIVWSEQEAGDALALNAYGELVFINLGKEGYTEYWRDQIIGKTWAHPAYSNNRVFSRDDKSVVCHELPLATKSVRK